MANEITVTVSLSGYKSTAMSAAVGRSVSGATFTMTANTYVECVLPIATSATALTLGAVATPHWGFFKNLDSTNFVKIRNGASGADLIKLLAGEFAVVPLLDTATPYAVADTATCRLEYLIFGL